MGTRFTGQTPGQLGGTSQTAHEGYMAGYFRKKFDTATRPVVHLLAWPGVAPRITQNFT